MRQMFVSDPNIEPVLRAWSAWAASSPPRCCETGGLRQSTAIKAALRGGWVNVLITDLQVARSLVAP